LINFKFYLVYEETTKQSAGEKPGDSAGNGEGQRGASGFTFQYALTDSVRLLAVKMFKHFILEVQETAESSQSKRKDS
jgi:hypothetical protein